MIFTFPQAHYYYYDYYILLYSGTAAMRTGHARRYGITKGQGNMKFSCGSSELVNAILTAVRVMAVRSPIEMLDGVLIEADDYNVRVTASDGKMTSITEMDAQIEEKGSIILPGRLISEVVRKLPQGTASVSLKGNVLTLRCGISRTNIAGRNADDYPLPDESGFEDEITLPQPMMKEMIQQISFAVPLEDQRVVLTGGLFNLANGILDMVGLDGYRMAVRTAKLSDTGMNAKAIIPLKVLDELEKLMSDDENERVKLRFGRGRLLAECGNTKLYASLIEGEYIDYKRVTPTGFNTVVKVDKQLFSDSIDRAALIARMSKNNLIRLDISDGLMVISAISDVGDAREEIECETEGSELTISFNVRYLTEFLRVTNGDELTMKFGKSISPCIITPNEGEMIYLVLPVRTNA